MTEEFWPGISLGRLGGDELLEIQEALEEVGEFDEAKEVARADVLRFFGMWRPRTGGDLRVGLRRNDNRFLAVSSLHPAAFPIQGPVDVVMETLLMPHLPTSRCT